MAKVFVKLKHTLTVSMVFHNAFANYERVIYFILGHLVTTFTEELITLKS